MALIFYARISSKEQNLARQLTRAKVVHADKIFTDQASGKSTKRPGLQKMMDYIREGDVVEVTSLDRLSRSYHDIQQIMQQFKEQKVKLVIDDLPQTKTDNQLVNQFMLDMMVNLLGFVAENERVKIRERQRQGIKEAKRRGAYHGRSKKYAPDSKNREGRLVFNGIKRDYLTGNYKSKTQLAERYGISRQQLYRIVNALE